MIPHCLEWDMSVTQRNNMNCDGCPYCDDPYVCTIPQLLQNFPIVRVLLMGMRK